MPASTATFATNQVQQFSEQIKNAAKSLNIVLDDGKISKFIDYLALFHKWNAAYNLSAIRDPQEMLSKHLLDSLTVLPHIHSNAIADIGTGAGLPGIPLAICFPNKKFTLVDSNGKKTRFLFQAKQSLQLQNIDIQHTRVENWQPETLFDELICRAYSSVPNIVETCSHLLHSEGKILAMKGLIPTDELREIEKHYIVDAIHSLAVPGLTGERNLIILAKRS